MSQPGNTEISTKLAKRLRGECRHCAERAIEGSDYCGPHDAHEKGMRAARQRRRRQRLAKSGLCSSGCGRKVPRRRKQGGGFKATECKTCSKTHRKRSADARMRVRNDSDACVTTAVGNWREDPGTTWMRFRGKARRGRLTREEQIAEDARDARFAIEELEKFIAALGQLAKPEVMALPTIQREAAKRQVSQYLGSAGRFLDDLQDKYGG